MSPSDSHTHGLGPSPLHDDGITGLVKRGTDSTSTSAIEKSSQADLETAITTTDASEELVHKKKSLVAYAQLHPYILTGLALVILGWWISSTVLQATRHRWWGTLIALLPETEID